MKPGLDHLGPGPPAPDDGPVRQHRHGHPLPPRDPRSHRGRDGRAAASRTPTIDYDTRAAHPGLSSASIPAKRLTVAELDLLPASTWTDKDRLAAEKAFETSTHNTSTPREIGLLLEKCVKGEFVDRETSDRVLETMKSHTGAELILRYLPMDTAIARKGGSLARDGENTVLLDSGVVWLPENAGTLVICLFGNGLREVHYELKHKMGLMARAAYDYFLEKNKKPAKS